MIQITRTLTWRATERGIEAAKCYIASNPELQDTSVADVLAQAFENDSTNEELLLSFDETFENISEPYIAVTED